MPGLKSQREPEQRRQVLDHAKRMPGLRFRAEIWMLRVAKAWPRPCPSAVQVPCALNLAFPLRPLGFNGGGEDSDSLDTSGEYALYGCIALHTSLSTAYLCIIDIWLKP